MGKKEKRPAKVVTEATFDPEARRQWLTGFSKRKRERRMKGLAYGALKERAEKLTARAARRSANPKPKAEEATSASREPAIEKSTVEYDDSEVMEQWGSTVTVTTTLGLDVDSEDEERATALLNKQVEPEIGKDVAQISAGSLEAMKKKVAPGMGRSAKAVKRAARKRDANPHYNGGSKRKGGPDAKTLVDNASKKRKKR